MNKPYLKEKCAVTSLVTVVDSLNYFDYIDSFGYFFEDQIVNASTLILSKTQHIDDKELNNIISSLRKLNTKAYIISEDWDNLSPNQIIKLLQGNILADLEHTYNIKSIFNTIPNISSISIKTSKIYSKKEIENILNSLSEGKDGKILRAKGFLKSNDGNLEFNYTNGHYTINKSEIQDCGKLCVIGSNLNKDNIKIIFQ
jgi:G3E family GTPase